MTTSVSPYLMIHAVLVARKSNKSLSIPIELSSEKNVKNVDKIHALVDTGCYERFYGLYDTSFLSYLILSFISMLSYHCGTVVGFACLCILLCCAP